jgi:SAM-dependent methyltransferase
MNFAEHRFTTQPQSSRWLLQVVERQSREWAQKRAMEIGCGSGYFLALMAEKLRPRQCFGLDISEANIQLARRSYGQIPNMSFAVADYMQACHGQYDLVVSVSVLHLLAASDAQLAHKLAQEVCSQGLLIFTMPVPCMSNYLRLSVRVLLKKLRWPAIDRLVLRMAKRIYADWSEAELRERLAYLRAIPRRWASRGFLRRLQNEGFRLERRDRSPSASAYRLRHELFIFRKI